MTYDDLLPCPFCGSTNLRFEFAGSQGYIECNECGTEGPCDEQAADPHCDIEAAYDAWNRRPAALADGPAVPDGREPASVAMQPSDEELLELMPQTMRDEFSYAATACSDATGGQVKPGIFRVCLNTVALEYARAVLDHWSNSMTNPDSRALCAELLNDLEHSLFQQCLEGEIDNDPPITRARALLDQPVAEGPTDDELLRIAAISIEPYESSGIAFGEYEPETECAVEVYGSELIAYARAVLARWGHQ